MIGKIVKGIGGFYYVAAEDGKLYECKARGLFRKEKMKPLVGDDCEIEILDAGACLGNLEKVLPRRNTLTRPAVANADQAIVIFAVSQPEPGYSLIDRYLVRMSYMDMPVILLFNKVDQDRAKGEELQAVYEKAGYTVVLTSAKTGEGTDRVRELLAGKTSVFSGPSGVGKSSMLNHLYPEIQMETGAISEKIGRGKHTTRHSELTAVGGGTYLCDTPGFSSVELPEQVDEATLELCFPEFLPHLGTCRFASCRHLSEPDCTVKQALDQGKIGKTRYESYKAFQEILKDRRKNEWK